MKPPGHTQRFRHTRNLHLCNPHNIRHTRRARHPDTTSNMAESAQATAPHPLLMPHRHLHRLRHMCRTPLSRIIRSIAAGALREDPCAKQSQA